MIQKTPAAASTLFEADETAWLDATSELLRSGRWAEVDTQTLAEYLEDMARRDRREVESRLTVLLTHVLKWFHQPEQRSRSWKSTIVTQRQELEWEASQGVLRNHAEAVLDQAYQKAVERTTAETGLELDSFPAVCPYRFEQLLSAMLLDDEATGNGG